MCYRIENKIVNISLMEVAIVKKLSGKFRSAMC